MTEFKHQSEFKSGIHRLVKDGLQIPYSKNLYLVWYSYSRYLQKNKLVIKRDDKTKDFGKLDKKVLKDWNLPDSAKRKTRMPSDEYSAGFDKWWKDNWRNLFAEKTIGHVHAVNEIPKKKEPDTIYISVPLDTSPIILRSKCKEIIDNQFKSRKINLKNISSNAQYLPDVPINFNYRVLMRMLNAKILRDSGMTNKQIYGELRDIWMKTKTTGKQSLYDSLQEKDYMTVWREVARDYSNAEVLLKDVRVGLFCTKDFSERRKTKNLFSSDTSVEYFKKKKRKKKK